MACACGICTTCIATRGACGPPLVERLQPTVDKLRQRFTSFGLRNYVVLLVWTRWGGLERGEGHETILAQVPILPRPKVIDLTSVSLSAYSAGLLPVGSVRVEEITGQLTEDVLMGKQIPPQPYLDACGAPHIGAGQALPPDILARTSSEMIGQPFVRVRDRVEEPFEFFYEIVEDRPNSTRKRFRLLSSPFRDPGKFQWMITLERMSEDRQRDGHLSSESRDGI